MPRNKIALEDLIKEFDSLDEIDIHGKTVKVQKFLGGDLKFLHQVTGINSFSGKYSCVWCKCPGDSRSDMSQNWSMIDRNQGARTN